MDGRDLEGHLLASSAAAGVRQGDSTQDKRESQCEN
jgi:hypothetical protein